MRVNLVLNCPYHLTVLSRRLATVVRQRQLKKLYTWAGTRSICCGKRERQTPPSLSLGSSDTVAVVVIIIIPSSVRLDFNSNKFLTYDTNILPTNLKYKPVSQHTMASYAQLKVHGKHCPLIGKKHHETEAVLTPRKIFPMLP